MSIVLYFSDLRGPPRPFPRTPWGSMDPRLRTYALGVRGTFFNFQGSTEPKRLRTTVLEIVKLQKVTQKRILLEQGSFWLSRKRDNK